MEAVHADSVHDLVYPLHLARLDCDHGSAPGIQTRDSLGRQTDVMIHEHVFRVDGSSTLLDTM
jgi:hypothetical protein